MRRYETICILRPTLAEEQINTLIENTTNIIQSDSGQIIDLDKWGLKKLAYPIKKETLGFYFYCDFAGSPEAVAEMERKFRIDDSVLRYLTVKISDSITSDQVEVEKAKLVQRKEAAASAASESESDDDEDSSDAVEEATDGSED